MAFFKFRKGGDATPATPAQAESVEVLRRRARHRLIGAAVLVLIGVIGFPLLFDTQPRPVAVDIPIEIPDRNKAKPLPVPAAKAPSAAGAVTTASASTPAAPKAEAKVDPKPEPKAEEPKPAPKPEPVAKAPAALPEAKTVQAEAREAPVTARFVVQVGAFADAGKAREARAKLEKAGLKTYTHEAETKEGKRIRVRVGPFATRAEADKAAAKIERLDLSAKVLTL